MVYFNEDSSDSENELVDTKISKPSPNKRKKSKDSFEAHGVVVGANKSPVKKSPSKQQVRNKRGIDSVDDTNSRSPSKKNLQKNNEYDNTSDEEPLAKSKTTKIKMENFSSDDESKHGISKRSIAVRAGNNSFDEDDDETIPKYQNQSMNMSDENEIGDTLSQGTNEKTVKKHRIFIKREIISSEDDETIQPDDNKLINNDTIIQEENATESESDQGKGGSGNNSDSEIPPSQFWLHQRKEVEKMNNDEKGPIKKAKKSSPFKNLDFYENNKGDEEEKELLKAEVTIKKEISRKQSPPRITKTEIVSRKFKRIDGKIVKDEEESNLENDRHRNSDEKDEMEDLGGWRESTDDDDIDSDDKILTENNKSQSNESREGKLDVEKKLSKKKNASPVKKRQSPEKQPTISPKRKSTSGPNVPTKNSSIETKSNTKGKKKKLDDKVNDEPLIARPNICDDDTSSEEKEENVKTNETSKNYVLQLERPKNSNKQDPNCKKTQMLLVLKSENETIRNNASNSLHKSKASPRKPSIVHNNDVNDEYLAEGSPVNKLPEDTISDSDDTDSLTKLNTTLNKSMALMENKKAEVKLNTSRKSVSINTKYEIAHTPIDARNQKSILKKPAAIVGNDNSESSSDSQEQNVPEALQPINDVTTTPKTIKRPINLQNMKQEENLISDSTKASFVLGDLSDDDEIYILDVPKSMDLTELKGQTIKLGGKNKLRIENQLYETCNKEAKNISCVFRTDKEQSSYRIVNLKPAGRINIRQKLSKPLGVELSSLEKKTVPFPDKLKIRHPLFGAEYEDKILMINEKVSKLIGKTIKREELTAKTNAAAKIEKSSPKLKIVEKNKNQKVEQKKPKKPNKSKNTSEDRVKKSLNLDDSDSPSNDSDGGFFQEVKLENIGKHEKRRKSNKSTTILDLEEPLLAPHVPENSDETVADVKQKKISGNRKLGLSCDSLRVKNTSFLSNVKNSEFFSSTPIKIENSGEEISDGKILTGKIRKRKTNDGVLEVTKSPKKVKKAKWSMSAFETKKKKISV